MFGRGQLAVSFERTRHMSLYKQAARRQLADFIGNSGWRSPSSRVTILLSVFFLFSLPSLALYFQFLWSRPHYQFFPFALLFIGYVIYQRHQDDGPIILADSSLLGDFFLWLALPFFVFHLLVFDIDFAAIGCFFVAASIMTRLRDAGRTAFAGRLIFPLAIIIRPPFNFDTQLIAHLQRVTSVLTGWVLDAIGVLHVRNGNVITLPTRNEPLMVEEACSGVQSLFTLIFIATAWSVWSRRHLAHIILLMAAAVIWACFGNMLRVTSICLADYWYGIDLVTEPQHSVLGYICLAIGGGLVMSTDQWMESVRTSSLVVSRFGLSVDSRAVRSKSDVQGGQLLDDPLNHLSSPASSLMSWRMIGTQVLCLALCLVTLAPIILAGPMRLAKHFFRASSVGELERNAIPDIVQIANSQFSQWSVSGFNVEKRDRSSIWGSYSASWQIACADGPRPIDCHFSCDYPFNDWHELSVCYRGNGWRIVGNGRRVHYVKGQDDWPIVSVELANDNGGNAFLLYSLFDESGSPVRPPDDDILSMGLVDRVKNFVARRLGKKYGPRPSTFQVQAFVTLTDSMTEQDQLELIAAYSALRNEVVEEAVGMDLG